MTDTIRLRPLEWAIVAALRQHGELTTGAIRRHVAAAGFETSTVGVRARLADLERFGVIRRVRAGGGNRGGRVTESAYTMRMA